MSTTVELETVASQREWFGKHVAAAQERAAEMHAATDEARDDGRLDRAIFGQTHGAKLHQQVAEMLEWLADDQFMAEWVSNINRGREDRVRETAVRASQAASEAGSYGDLDGASVLIYLQGLGRYVQ